MSQEPEADGIGVLSVETTGPASAYSREAEAIAALERSGFTGEFVAEDGRLRLIGTDRRFRPRELSIRNFLRFEGASDPGDMSIVYAIEARDGTRGTLVDAFGPYADPAVGALVGRIRLAPGGLRDRLLASAVAIVAGIAVGIALVQLLQTSVDFRPAHSTDRGKRERAGRDPSKAGSRSGTGERE